MQRYYAVKVGRKTGVFLTWDECEKNVKGYPGALYKSFSEIDQAYAYLGNDGTQLTFDNLVASEPEKKDEDANSSFIGKVPARDDAPYANTIRAVAYVDGSFNDRTNTYGYGVVLFFNGYEYHFAKAFQGGEMAEMRNVAGEIAGSMAAMDFALENNIKTLIIHHDYIGISSWCTGGWKTNKAGTIAYKKHYDKIKHKIHISFEKVKAHSGDKYNEAADRLAKSAAGVTED